MRKRWGVLLSLLILLTTAAACGDDGDTEAGSGAITIPASCGHGQDAENGDDSETGADGDTDETSEATEAGEATGQDPGEDLTPVTVGILPIADLAPLYYGIEEGFFAEEGLDVSMTPGQGGAALVPAVTTGEYQFAFGNYVSLMLARQNDVGVQIVSNIVDGAATPDQGTNGLLVDPDEVESMEDLAGKTFAVTTLENVAEVNIRTTLRANGVDDSDISFVELPFPDMNSAVEAGEVDVAWTAEPFVTLGEAAGLVNLVDPMYETTPSMPLAGIFADEAWLEENPDIANAFHRAMARSLEASSDEEVMREAIVANTETPPDVVGDLALANWDPELDTEKLSCVGELAAAYEILDEEPNLEELVWTPEE